MGWYVIKINQSNVGISSMHRRDRDQNIQDECYVIMFFREVIRSNAASIASLAIINIVSWVELDCYFHIIPVEFWLHFSCILSISCIHWNLLIIYNFYLKFAELYTIWDHSINKNFLYKSKIILFLFSEFFSINLNSALFGIG